MNVNPIEKLAIKKGIFDQQILTLMNEVNLSRVKIWILIKNVFKQMFSMFSINKYSNISLS